MISIRYARGLELPDQRLWLDPSGAKPLAFVSHAHSDHIAAHAEIVASTNTIRLMRARLGGKRWEHALEFGATARYANFDITLLPAGHILGSAQSFIESDAGSLLYTGDFKLRPGLSTESTEFRHADTLVMETTFGLPRYHLPPTEEVIAGMVAFCHDALEDGAVPVLFGYSLGKAQEVLCALQSAGFTPMLHDSVLRMTEIYRQLKPDFPSNYLPYEANEVAGKVLICPPNAHRTPMVTQIKNRRTAVLTGWALDPGATFRYQCDAAFPLSDHADYPDLLRYVELVQPRRVLTLHGFAAAFAADLRERGVEAWALSQENQLELALRGSKAKPASCRPVEQREMIVSVQSEFGNFTSIGEKVGATSSQLKKAALLVDYFRNLPRESLPIAARYLSGKAFVQSEGRPPQISRTVIKRALLAASGISEQSFLTLSRHHADPGKTAYEALLNRTAPRPFSLAESAQFFDRLLRVRGPAHKATLIQQRLAALSAVEGSYIVRLLTGNLRIGLKEELVEEAIASAFAEPLESVREAQMLIGDLGKVATLAARGALTEAPLQLFRPIPLMLANPKPSAEPIWERVSANRSPGTWTEDSFKGIRAQVHIGGNRIEIYTRDLRQVSARFPDLTHAARTCSHTLILDGEIVADQRDRRFDSIDLQKRLEQPCDGDLFLGTSDIPVIFKAFDLLYQDGASLLRSPIALRRLALESLDLPTGFQLAPAHRVASTNDIEAVACPRF